METGDLLCGRVGMYLPTFWREAECEVSNSGRCGIAAIPLAMFWWMPRARFPYRFFIAPGRRSVSRISSRALCGGNSHGRR